MEGKARYAPSVFAARANGAYRSAPCTLQSEATNGIAKAEINCDALPSDLEGQSVRALLLATTIMALPAAAFACGNYEQQLAHNFVKDHVKDQLRSPRKADFPFSPTNVIIERSGGACVVKLMSWVDAPNAFGTEVRQRYVAEVRIGGNDVTIVQFGFTD